MERVNGLVIKLQKSRIKLLNDLSSDNLIFSEPVPWFTHGNKTPLLCFVFDSDYMTHISLGNAGKMAGTNLRRVNLYHVVKLNHPISIDKIIEGVKRTTKNYLCEP
ncbi:MULTISPECIES: hypothetical protein [unclassified Desulfovibrio]|uniref:hypothetical protein n=1 Tax=unclassified Desulfovibrio TaxID=2593640 RepID=UPI0013ED4429|nr:MULTISPECIES: hypothetical protein [unclassified Desulfovibrio]